MNYYLARRTVLIYKGVENFKQYAILIRAVPNALKKSYHFIAIRVNLTLYLFYPFINHTLTLFHNR